MSKKLVAADIVVHGRKKQVISDPITRTESSVVSENRSSLQD